MAHLIEIITDSSVQEFISILSNNADIEAIREFDSANYGEGYDFNMRQICCRIYDDSDAVSNEDEQQEKFLFIEIDKYNEYAPQEQHEVLGLLDKIIAQAGFQSSSKSY